MEETETPHPDYLKGFNEGYMISKHLPDLAGKLPSALGENERGKGFLDGKQQFLAEKNKDRTPSWLKNDRLSNLNNKSAPVTKDKKKDGPER